MTPKMINGVANASTKRGSVASTTGSISRMDFATLGRAPLRLTMGTSHRVTSRDLQIIEATDELLEEDVPEPDGVAQSVSLLRGFNATIPTADKSRIRRRQARNVDAPRLGLKRIGMQARGMLGEDEDHESVVSEDDVVLVGSTAGAGGKKGKGKRKGRPSLSASVMFGRDELIRQSQEIQRDKENMHVRRVCAVNGMFLTCTERISQALINNEIAEITHKIEALDAIRTKLEQDLLKLQEDELELDDECKLSLHTLVFIYFIVGFSGRCQGAAGD
jgi:mitochondrial division protein 1